MTEDLAVTIQERDDSYVVVTEAWGEETIVHEQLNKPLGDLG